MLYKLENKGLTRLEVIVGILTALLKPLAFPVPSSHQGDVGLPKAEGRVCGKEHLRIWQQLYINDSQIYPLPNLSLSSGP